VYLSLPEIETKSKEELIIELQKLQNVDDCLAHLGKLVELGKHTGICILTASPSSFYVGPVEKLLEWIATFMDEICKKNNIKIQAVLSQWIGQVNEEDNNDKV